MHRTALLALLLAAMTMISTAAHAVIIGGCKFDTAEHQFRGNSFEQAKCLLRKVKPKGAGAIAQPIPNWLKVHMGQPVALTKLQLEKYLQARSIPMADLAGALNPNDVPDLRYFVIHDTSYPEEAETTGFPPNIDSPNYRGNKLAAWTGNIAKRVNLLVTRDGRSKLFRDWGAARPLAATKIEMRAYSAPSKKYFVHVENVQPRLKPAKSFAWIAPTPGFSSKQQERLALAYIVASFRAGKWLIPAYHFNIDEGVPNGHDDPQNTDLATWVSMIERIEANMNVTAVSSHSALIGPTSQPSCTAQWRAHGHTTQVEAKAFAEKCLSEQGAVAQQLDIRTVAQKLAVLLKVDSPLSALEPTDIAVFCPGYVQQSREAHAAFWRTVFEVIIGPESGFNTMTAYWETGQRQYSIGLLQLSLADERSYRCGFKSEVDITDPDLNLNCGIKIMTKLVGKAGLIGGDRAHVSKGAGAYWSTLRYMSDARARVIHTTRRLQACKL